MVPDLGKKYFVYLKDISMPIEYGLGASAIEFDGNNIYVRITDIDDETSEFNYTKLSSPSFFEDKYLLQNGDILIARTGASVGKSYLHNDISNAYFAGFLMRVRLLKHNPYYIYAQFKTTKFKKWLQIMSIRSGQPGINSKELGLFKVYIADKDEEEKIGNILRTIDLRIATQKKIIDKLKSLIISIKNTEFYNTKGFKEKLENILIEINEKTIINNQYEVLSSTVKGIFKQSDYFDRAVASENNIGYKIVKRGNIVISPQNLWMGNISYNDKFDIGIVSPSYKIFNISSNYNECYIFEMLTTKKSLYLFKTVSEQGASVVRRNLNYDAFMQLAFNIPPLNEQNNFIEKLSLLQNKLSIENKILSLLEKQKQYLLDKLFI